MASTSSRRSNPSSSTLPDPTAKSGLRACLKIGSSAAAWDFGFGRDGVGGTSPERAVTPATTKAKAKRPAGRSVFASTAVWLRCSSVEDSQGVFNFVAPRRSPNGRARHSVRAVVVNQNALVPTGGSQRTAIPTDDLECARPRAQQRPPMRRYGKFERLPHVSPCCGRGRPRSGNASDFIPLTLIPLTELAVGNATGRADLARRNQRMAEGQGKRER